MPAAAPTRMASAELSLSNKVRAFFDMHFQKQYFSLAAWLTFLSCIVIIKITSKLYHVKI